MGRGCQSGEQTRCLSLCDQDFDPVESSEGLCKPPNDTSNVDPRSRVNG